MDLAAVGCPASQRLLMLCSLFGESGLRLTVELALDSEPLLSLHKLLRLDLAVEDTSDESCIVLSLDGLLSLGKVAKHGVASRGHLEVRCFALAPVFVLPLSCIESHLILEIVKILGLKLLACGLLVLCLMNEGVMRLPLRLGLAVKSHCVIFDLAY